MATSCKWGAGADCWRLRFSTSSAAGTANASLMWAAAPAPSHSPSRKGATSRSCAASISPPLTSNTPHAAIVIRGLFRVPRADRAVAEMLRVSRPGAVVGAAVWDARGGFVANRLLFDTAAALDSNANERRARDYTRPMTPPGELARAWWAAGLNEVRETTLSIRMEFASFADYWAPYVVKDGPGASMSRPSPMPSDPDCTMP